MAPMVRTTPKSRKSDRRGLGIRLKSDIRNLLTGGFMQKRMLLTPALVLCFALNASAQFNGSIEGTITDASQAGVSDAQVVLVQESTQFTQRTTSSESGFFRITQLPPGEYRLEVGRSGFKTWVQTKLVLAGGEARTVYPMLAVGEQVAKVEVTAAIGAIETSSSNISRSVEEKTLSEVPMVGRNAYASIAALAPGVTGSGQLFASGAAFGTDSFQSEPGYQINAAGQRQEQNEYDVDGTSVNGNSRDGIANLTPEPDTIQEIRVSANSFSAEKGRNSGALVEVYTKSGTNQLHGTLSEFHTNNALTSRTVFQSTSKVPVFRRNEYGFTAGGPVVKDRTFVFGAFHHLSSSASQTDVVAAETPQFVQYLKQYFPNNISTRILSSATIGSSPVSGFVTANTLKASARNPVPATLPGDLPVLGTSFVNETLSRPAGQWNTRLDQYLRQYKDRIYFNYFNYFSKAQSANPRPLQRITQPNYGMYGKA